MFIYMEFCHTIFGIMFMDGNMYKISFQAVTTFGFTQNTMIRVHSDILN